MRSKAATCRRRSRRLSQAGDLALLLALARRLLTGVVVVFAASVLVFFLVEAAPGDPAIIFTDVQGAADVNARQREILGLDQPMPVRFVKWIQSTATLDFGLSLVDRRPVRDRVLEALPRTLILSGSSLLLGFAAGLGIALACARRPGRFVDQALSGATLLIASTPIFWISSIAVWWCSIEWPLFPAGGELSTENRFVPGWHLGDRMWHLALPCLVLSGFIAAHVARYARAALVEAQRQDFVLAARARGATRGRALLHHALPASLHSTVALLGLSMPYLVGGAVLVEMVFEWPGMGTLLLGSLTRKDFPVATPCLLLLSLTAVLGNVVADLLAERIDPRVDQK